MQNNVVCFDVETTGLNPVNNFIIQLAMVKFDLKTFETIDQRNWYIKPAHVYEISPEAQSKHGITKEFLEENGVTIKSIAQEIIDFVSDSDYLTFNGNTFDVKFLYKDLEMFGFTLPMKDKIFYDAFSLYKTYHPSTLEAIYKNYTGKDLEGSHNAFNDVNATIEVFKHLQKETGVDIAEWAESPSCQMLSPEGSIRRASHPGSDENIIVFACGKHKDEEICEVLAKDYQYTKWFAENVASQYTRDILRKYVQEKRNK